MAPPPSPAVLLRIEGLGAEADGLARWPDGSPAFIPHALPGDLVEAVPTVKRGEGWAGDLLRIIESSPDRRLARCAAFGSCGGCSVQQWNDASYAAWKRGLLTAALRRAGFPAAPVAELVRTAPQSRRRADLALLRSGSRVVAGLHRRGGRQIINIDDCQVLDPALVKLAGALEDALPATGLVKREASAVINLTDSGPDLLLRGDAEPDAGARSRLAVFASSHGIARISWAKGNGTPETLCLLRVPRVQWGGIIVEPPPGAFLQASVEGETAIVGAVLAGLPGKRQPKARVFDLYAGCGTISFALAAHAPVVAVEGDAGAHAALRKASGGTRVLTEQRDLNRRPLLATELKAAAAVVLDPPHAGAGAQMPQLAASGVGTIIYVSCHPASLARDAALLAGQYEIAAATPIDQFPWSARLESVVVFRRPR